MFFATYVLTQKGPLAKVWLAAHWEKKLTAKDVKVIDLQDTIVHVIQPTVPIALRTSGELMLGIVRIYALKVQHLLKEATDQTQALLKPRAINLVKVSAADLKGAATILTGADGSKGALGAAATTNTTGKGAAELQTAVAITMDITVGRLGAEQLLDADFAEVADLLGGAGGAADGAAAAAAASKAAGKKVKGKKGAADAKADGGEWWFATEASQTVEEMQYNSRTDGEIARFRAELDKSTSGTGSKKGSSGSTGASSSVEQQRGGGAAGEAGALDIGNLAGLGADDFLLGGDLGSSNNNNNALPGLGDILAQAEQFGDDPFAQFPAQQPTGADDEEASKQAQQAKKGGKTKRIVILMDAETCIKPDQMRKLQESTSDIVFPERRRGPVDDTDAQDRVVLRQDAIVGDFTPLACYFSHDVLKAAFHTAVEAVAAERLSELEKLRSAAGLGGERHGRPSLAVGDGEEGAKKKGKKGVSAAAANENPFAFGEEAFMLPEMMEQQQMQLEEEEEQAQKDSKKKGGAKRRGRGGEDGEDGEEEGDGFSASTLDLLKSLRDNLLKAGAKSTTTLRIMEGKKNLQEACRAFVDLLHLASHQFVSVHQAAAFGTITVERGTRFNQKV